METHAATVNGYESGARETGRASDRRKAAGDPDRPPVCCGKPMETRLARARDRWGQTLFAAVWLCPACGRVVFQ